MRSLDHAALRLLVVAGIGAAIGAATSFGQTFLPDELRPLANSSGSWCAVAFLLAGVARRPAEGAAAGGLTLVALLTGYEMTSVLRGFGVGVRSIFVWSLAAVTAGPALGVGRRWRGAHDVRRRAWGVGVLPGVLVGEGITSLATVAGTTFAGYWIGSSVAGLLVFWLLGRSELGDSRGWALAAACGIAVAAAFVVAYLVVLPALL